MSVVRLGRPAQVSVELTAVPSEVTEGDLAVYRRLVSTDLTDEQVRRIVEPPMGHERPCWWRERIRSVPLPEHHGVETGRR